MAGGGVLQSSLLLCKISWTVDSCLFQSDFRVIPLTSFDAIIGMDWLEMYSPMQVHWHLKWLAIPYDGQVRILQGLLPDNADHLLLHIASVDSETASADHAAPMPPSVSLLIEEFEDLFQPPTSLPPSRACNHEIPLVPGAQPVFIRPYRYSPKLKDEIEHQVHDMLSQGIIQPSASPFSSPMLLVRKKDDSYRFCMDFCHLNTLMRKSKFPVPVFDQLMDELAHSRCFSTLDLRAGFHQILLQPGEEFKKAFQTHLG